MWLLPRLPESPLPLLLQVSLWSHPSLPAEAWHLLARLHHGAPHNVLTAPGPEEDTLQKGRDSPSACVRPVPTLTRQQVLGEWTMVD